MKKDLGKIPALYPVPAVVLGAMDGDKPSWTLAAHLGTVGHDRLMISLVKNHYINELIKNTGKVTVNLVSEEMLPEADEAGSVSGRTKDKSGLFEWSEGAVIDKAPISILCSLEQIVETPGFENMICTIDSALANEEVLSDQGKSIMRKPPRFCSNSLGTLI